jgi:hypothetical protein
MNCTLVLHPVNLPEIGRIFPALPNEIGYVFCSGLA